MKNFFEEIEFGYQTYEGWDKIMLIIAIPVLFIGFLVSKIVGVKNNGGD